MPWWTFAIFIGMLAVAGGYLLRMWLRRQKEYEEKLEKGVKIERKVPMAHFGALLFGLLLLLAAVGREFTRLDMAETRWQAIVLLIFGIGLLGVGIYMTYELVFKKDGRTEDDGSGGE